MDNDKKRIADDKLSLIQGGLPDYAREGAYICKVCGKELYISLKDLLNGELLVCPNCGEEIQL